MDLLRREAAIFFGYIVLAFTAYLGKDLAPEHAGQVWSTVGFVVLFLVMMWLAFAVVRHAEGLATLLGEPYGTLILTLSVTGIEVALISSVMIIGENKPALARDTMFAVLMIVLNGLIGLSLTIGGFRHRLQVYNLQGAQAYLAVLIPLAVLGLILPRFTYSAPGGELSRLQAPFFIGLSVILYGIFLAIQTLTLSDIFQQPRYEGADAAKTKDKSGGGGHGPVLGVAAHTVGLVLAMLPIVLLSKALAMYVDFGISVTGAPAALSGFLVATLVLTPEGLSAIQSAKRDRLQRAVNICLGSALATIALTIPSVLILGWLTGRPVELGLGSSGIVLLSVTLLLSIVTFGSQRTNILLGAVHLAIFASYVMLIFDGAL